MRTFPDNEAPEDYTLCREAVVLVLITSLLQGRRGFKGEVGEDGSDGKLVRAAS